MREDESVGEVTRGAGMAYERQHSCTQTASANVLSTSLPLSFSVSLRHLDQEKG